LEGANKFLEGTFMPWWNKKLTVTPAIALDAHVPVGGLDLRAVFSEQATRVVQRDFTFRLDSQRYQLAPSHLNAKLPKARITVEQRLDGTLRARLGSEYLRFHKI
jgi:hypothetical protein